MIIVDTHAHIYSEDTEKYPQIPNPYLPQPGHGTIEHLKEEAENSNVHRVVIVQTFTVYAHDNRLTIDVVRESQDWTTGVLNVEPFDEKSVEVMEEARSVGVLGNRVSAGWPADDSVLKEHRRLWEAAGRLDMVICALLNPPNCRSLSKLLEEFPGVPVVLDHCANLRASDFPNSENLKTVLELSKFENLYAKLSFIVTGSEEEFPCGDMFDMVRKSIWGSDFPTSLWIPKVTYQQHLEIFQEHLKLSDDEKAAILGETAMELWF